MTRTAMTDMIKLNMIERISAISGDEASAIKPRGIMMKIMKMIIMMAMLILQTKIDAANYQEHKANENHQAVDDIGGKVFQ